MPGLVYDTHRGEFLQEFCYVYNETYYDLGKAVRGMEDFNTFVSSTVEIKNGERNCDPQNEYFAYRAAFDMRRVGSAEA